MLKITLLVECLAGGGHRRIDERRAMHPSGRHVLPFLAESVHAVCEIVEDSGRESCLWAARNYVSTLRLVLVWANLEGHDPGEEVLPGFHDLFFVI